MRYIIDRIELKILLICKKEHVKYSVDKSDDKYTYQFDSFKLGFDTIEINLGHLENIDSLILFGSNDSLLQISDNINSKGKFLGLDVKDIKLTRINSDNTFLTIWYDNDILRAIEKDHYINKDKYTSNIFTQNNFKNTAKEKLYSNNSRPSKSRPFKFIRPENDFIQKNKNLIPDENGNINCHFCVGCVDCVNCIGCVNCKDCVDCTNCIECTDCYNSYDLIRCIDCQYCVDCANCNKMFWSDGYIGYNRMGSSTFFLLLEQYGVKGNNYKGFVVFPDSGSVLYHERIETFFLVNRFVPYYRSYDKARNGECFIQWNITRDFRRYWITKETSDKYKNRVYSPFELSSFFLMNKLKYTKTELNFFLDEYFDIDTKKILEEFEESAVHIAERKNPENDILKIFFQEISDDSTLFDSIITKPPSKCLYNELIYE